MRKLACFLGFLCVTALGIPERLPPLAATWTQGSTAPQAIRLRAFEDDAHTRVDFQFSKGNSRVEVLLEGPLPRFGDGVPVGLNARRLTVAPKALSVDVRLPKAGIYRLILSPSATSAFRFRLTPGPGATRASMPLSRFLDEVAVSNLTPFVESFRGWLDALGLEPAEVARQAQFLAASLKDGRNGTLERFPTLPSPALISAGLAKLQGHLPKQPVTFSDRELHGERLEDLLAKATPDRSGVPPRAHAKLPETIGYGHYPDQTVPARYAAQSPVLAEVLTSLAAGKGTITLAGKTVSSPRQVFQHLIATGHRVVVLEERTLANFLALTYRGQPVQWTTWMNTGVRLPSGAPVTIPSSHSQTTFQIEGPDVSARLSFYLGMYGVGFFAAIDERPAWTGFDRDQLADSSANPTAVLRAVDLATSYFRMIRQEQSTVAAGLPGGGYAYLGVCNDRSFIELALTGKVSTWPLLRPLTLAPPTGTDLDLVALMTLMPSDATPVVSPEIYREDAVRRIRQAVPANSTLLRDDRVLSDQIDALWEE